MSDQAPDWIGPVMRAGYTARGITYTILGGLTVAAAWTGGQAEGTQGALQSMRDEPFGVLLLWVVAIGVVCYAVWRLLAAWYDIENRGEDEKGLFARAALVVTGLSHAALGISVAALAMGDGSSGGDWTAKIFELPGGQWIAAAIGAAIAGAGIHYVIKGYQKKYERHIEVTATTRQLDPALRAGFVTYGLMLGIVGAFLLIAALRLDPSQAKGIGAALDYVRSMTFGRYLLGMFGLGLLAFALENFVEARYRIVPGTSNNKVESLKHYAKRKAREAAA